MHSTVCTVIDLFMCVTVTLQLLCAVT